MKHARSGAHRASFAVYGLAFVLLVVSAYLQLEGNTKAQLKYVYASIAVSVITLLVAALSLLLSRR